MENDRNRCSTLSKRGISHQILPWGIIQGINYEGYDCKMYNASIGNIHFEDYLFIYWLLKEEKYTISHDLILPIP